MSEGSRYELADLLLFSARTYYRQFELYNAELWPAQLLGIGLGMGILALVRSGTSRSARAVPLLLAACWLWVAWAFHLQRYADINWAATWFAAAFAAQGLMLLLAGAAARRSVRPLRAARSAIGLGLMVFALFVQPWIGVLFGRAWRQAEFFGLAPDPTVVFTLGVLLLLQPVGQGLAWTRLLPGMLWPIPLLWCAVSGATLWTMRSPDAAVMPLAALAAIVGLRIRVSSRA